MSSAAHWHMSGGAARYEHDVQPPFKPGTVVALLCQSCGFFTGWHRVDNEHLAAGELAEHECATQFASR